MTPPPLSPYEPLPASHPDHLWVAATRRGLCPAPPACAHVLELACGDGSNLIPMAWHGPRARFVGLEGSAAADAARDAAAGLGLDNVTFVRGDLDAIRRRGERYDYVVAHGVLSSISDAARDEVLDLIAEVLSERGVVYLDHMGRAGRLFEQRLRDLVRQRVGPLPTVAERVHAIRAILEALGDAPPEASPHAMCVAVEAAYARTLGDAALVTHFLAPYRRGYAPSEIRALAARRGLGVIGPGWDPALEQGAERALRLRLAPVADVDLEDFVELVTGRRTHSALLGRASFLAEAGAPPTTIDAGAFAAPLETRLPDVLMTPGIEAAFGTRSGALLRTKDPFDKAVLVVLRDAWPAGVAFPELMARARVHLAAALPDHPVAGAEAEARQAVELLRLHAMDAVRWRSAEPDAPRRRVSPLTAWQARRSYLLTDAAHRLVVVDELTRRAVGRLDAGVEPDALVAEVEAWRDAGELERVPVKGAAEPPDVSEVVRQILEGLTKAGLVHAEPR